MGEHFDWQIDTLSEDQLTGYFHQRIASHSWSAVKIDLYGNKLYVVHVLRQPWAMPRLIRPPKTRQLPEIALSYRSAKSLASVPHHSCADSNSSSRIGLVLESLL